MLLGGLALEAPLCSVDGIALRRATDAGSRVLVKLPIAEPPDARIAARLRAEFSIAERVRSERVLDFRRIVDDGERVATVLEPFDGAPLAELIPPQGFEIMQGLELCIQLAEGLHAMHVEHVVHGAIAPHAILYASASGAAKYFDLGARDGSGAETASVQALAYMSPEQTGRVARRVDHRSDLYAIGALYFHIFCGRPPFPSSDPLELVHSHLARLPPDPRAIRPGLSESIAAIVLKLLAKQPEDRFQTARGLLWDLEECRRRLASGEAAAFGLGRNDAPHLLRLPERLYGREQQLRELEAALQRARAGSTEVVLVSGYSGSGKSTFVERLRSSEAAKGGFFLAGKFEQLGSAVPYSALRQAFASLVEQVLGEADETVAKWREQLLHALSEQGQALIDVIPEVERLVGPQPPVEPLGPVEAQYRFTRIFRQFVQVFASSRRPFTLFLDDWQWADEASLRLLEALAASAEAQGLTLVAAYRDNEVDERHPVTSVIARLRTAGVALTEIAIRALSVQDIALLLADAFGENPEAVAQLALELHRRTEGNPFFLRAFLLDLYESRVLAVSAAGTWRWDLDRLARTPPPTSVVALMGNRLKRLPEQTREVLQVAACLGSVFDPAILARACALSEAEVHQRIAPALEAGAINADGGVLRFLHDRVQEATHALIPGPSQAALQLSIGRRLLEGLGQPRQPERLVQCVLHLNQGRALIEDPDERRLLAALNLDAGRLARRSSAYAAAARHAGVGMELLRSEGWQSNYEIALGLYELRAECEYLTGNFDFAETLYPEALSHARTELDRIRILNVQKDQYELQGRYLDAIAVLRRGLARVGITFPDEPSALETALREELAQMPVNLRGRRIADLVDAPKLEDPLRVATLKMLMGMWPSCYVAGLQSLLAVVSVRIANFSLLYGNCEISSAAYVNYSFVAGFITGDYEEAYEYGKAGMALAEQYPERSVRAWCCFLFGCGTLIWRRHLREGRPYLERAVELGIASGNIACASYAASYIVTDAFMQGRPLPEVVALYGQHFPFLRQNNPAIHLFGELGTLAVRELAGLPAFDEANLEPYRGSPFFMAVHVFGRLPGAYLFERMTDALPLAERALANVPQLLAGTFKVPETLFYAALTFCRAADDSADEEDRAALIRKTRGLCRHLATLAKHCPQNLGHKVALVEAELARCEGRADEAARGYEHAARLASENGFLQDEALAYELATRYWHARGVRRLAAASLEAALGAYETWGAQGKAAWLARRFAELRPAAPWSGRTSGSRVQGFEGAPLDLLSVTKASQAISSEIDFDRLLERLIRIIGENAGARRAVLFLNEGDQLVKAAAADLSGPGFVQLERQAMHRADVAEGIVRHVAGLGQPVLLSDAAREGAFTGDPYIASHGVRSVLCLPLRHKDVITGVVYLENDLSSGAFTSERMAVLELLLGQVTISLDNARLYARLKESEERLSSVFSQALAGIAQSDLSGRLVQVNARYCQITGRSAEELLSLRMQDITHPEDLPRNAESFRALVEGRGGPFTIEKRYVRPDGSEVWVNNTVSLIRDPEGRPKNAVAVCLDVTDRKRTQSRLDAQNRRNRLLWEAAAVLLTTSEPDAMLHGLFSKIADSLLLDAYANFMAVDSGEGLRLVSSEGVPDAHVRALAHVRPGEAVSGAVALRRERIIGMRIQDSVDPTFDVARRHGLRACACFPLLAGERLLGTLSFGSRRREAFEAEEIEFLETLSQYVTAAYERLRLIEQLRDQDRRKDEFLATLSHELRNPLAPIANGLQLMRLAQGDSSTLEQARGMMERQLRHMVRLVDDLLDVSRISRNKLELRLEWIDLASIVRGAVETSRPALDAAGHTLEISLPTGPVLLQADPVRLAQALSNLLNNAAKYTQRGGRIELVAGSDDGEAVIRVRDNGIGIAAEKLVQIFDMFVQVDQSLERASGGLGIGLTLAKRLVQMHGGRVEAHSEGPGKGSEFTVRLPVLAVPASRPAAASSEQLRRRAQPRRRVLVVDDNRDAADSLALLLEHWGHEVATAHEGMRAVELAESFRPDVALLDLGMPRLNGYEAATRIRASRGDATLLVALTGWGQDQDRRRSREAGFRFHLVKPVEPVALQRILAQPWHTSRNA